MRLNKYLFNRVNNKERERGQRSVVWLKRGQPCLHHLHVLSTVFSWRPFSSFSPWIILLPPSLPPPPLILPLLNQCDGCLVPLAWGLMAGGCGFASHGGVTLSRGWPCQGGSPLDIPGTHLHSATQLLSGFIVVLLFTRDVKDGVHQTKGWSNSGKDNNNDNDNSELFINYCILLHFVIYSHSSKE